MRGTISFATLGNLCRLPTYLLIALCCWHCRAQRLLTVVKHFDDKLDYCPSLPSVVAVLLQVLSEAEVYSVSLYVSNELFVTK